MSKKFVVETSARHIHVSRADFETLFGKDAVLHNKKDLSQPGQFACEEKVEVVGPRGSLKMSILGPERPATQVEVSASDARTLGVAAVIRESGSIEETPGCKVVGPCGEVEIDKGVIVAKRHIHFTPAEAAERNVKDKDVVWVKIETPERSLVFGDVVVRVNEQFSAAMHLDTDEANAAGCAGEVLGEIVSLA